MSIVFYEYGYCQEILRTGVKRITQRDLNYLAKYWEYEGNDYETIEKNIEDFCIKNNKDFNPIQSSKMIQRAITHAKNNNLRFPTPIIITQAEINTIRSLNEYTQEKFLFSMLVCAKFFKQHPSQKKRRASKYDGTLYSNSSIKDIQEIARTKITRRQWDELKHEFTIKSLISPTILGSNCWAIGFRNEYSKPCIVIEDYRNPIAYYQEYCGEEMIECESCGVKTAKRSYRHRMCKNCWKEKERENTKQYVRKFRGKNIL